MKPIVHQHETDILEFFGGDWSKVRMTTRFPGKGVFVLFTNRCGSNHLVDLMQQLPTLTMRNEIFNAVSVSRTCTGRKFETFDRYMRFMFKGCETPNWGAKVGCVQLDMLKRFGVLDAFDGGTYVIWLKRKNVIAQAVSHFIAHHNLQWASFHEPKGETPEYDFHSIRRMVNAILKHNSDAELSLSVMGIRYHALWYEDYVARPQAHMRRIAQYLDEPFEKVERERSKFKKQDDPVKKEYEARFREEARKKLAL